MNIPAIATPPPIPSPDISFARSASAIERDTVPERRQADRHRDDP